jgi:hypothetical protein
MTFDYWILITIKFYYQKLIIEFSQPKLITRLMLLKFATYF